MPAARARGAAWSDDPKKRLLARIGCVLAISVVVALVAISSSQPADSARQLPYLAFRSVLRMLIAFVLSTIFALTYGYVAATNKKAAKVMLPVLDVLQSVPILAFFPAAIGFFYFLFNQSMLGLEAASVFLIFTSQNWNMTFGVYEAVSTIPRETTDAGDVAGLRGWLRLKRIILPATVPKLVYNSIVSWASGWYFVTASEIISSTDGDFTLPGLGSFLVHAGAEQNLRNFALGFVVLVAVILAFEFLLWRPLQVWSERFKFESVRSGTAPTSRALHYYRILRGRKAVDAAVVPMSRVRLPERPLVREYPRAKKAAGWVAAVAAGSALLYLLYKLTSALVLLLEGALPADTKSIPLAIAVSGLRLLAAYAITVAWTVPTAIVIARNEKASRILVPLTEILASIPAIALFPLVLLIIVPITGGLGLPSVVLVLTGMQWYLLFNLIAGARQVPNDLIAVAELQGVKGWLLWREVLIPAMMPSFVTGSITAWGGGWNALIVSEYVPWEGSTIHTFGIGYLIDKATFENDNGLLLLSVLSLVAFVTLINMLFWKRMYRRVLNKYRLEG